MLSPCFQWSRLHQAAPSHVGSNPYLHGRSLQGYATTACFSDNAASSQVGTSAHRSVVASHAPSLCNCGTNTSPAALVLLPDISTQGASSARDDEPRPACFAAAPTVLAQSSCSSSWKDALDMLCRNHGFGLCVSGFCRQRYTAVLDHGLRERSQANQVGLLRYHLCTCHGLIHQLQQQLQNHLCEAMAHLPN